MIPFLPFVVLAAGPSWDLATADTRATIAIERDAPKLVHLSATGDAHDWAGAGMRVPLAGKAWVAGREVALAWTFARESRGEQAGGLTLEFLCADPPLSLRSIWRADPGLGPVEHEIEIENRSGQRITISHQDSLSLIGLRPAAAADIRWIKRGGSNASTQGGTFTQPLAADLDLTLVSDCEDGASPVPWLAVEQGDTRGLYVGWEFSGIGRVRARAIDDAKALAIEVGFAPEFRTDIEPGETFLVPPAFVGCYTGDVDEGSHSLHRFIIERLRPPLPPDIPDPILAYNLYLDAGGDKALEADVLRSARFSRAIGFEAFMPDAMWFPETGDWRWDPRRFPNGVRPIEELVHGEEMKLALWCAWTNGGVSEHADALSIRGARARPEWFQGDVAPDWKPGPFYGARICLGCPEALEWAIAKTRWLVSEHKLDYLKHDIGPIVTTCSRTTHRHRHGVDASYWAGVGYYRVQEKLLEAFPRLILENCSGGGHIKDFGVMRRSHYTVTTDTLSNLPDRQSIYDSTFAFPPLVLQAYTYDNYYPVEGDEPGPFLWRSAMMGAWQIDPTDTDHWTAGERESARRAAEIYKEWIRPMLRDVKVHHILPRPDGKRWDGMFYWSESLARGTLYIFRPDAMEDRARIRLKGLAPDRRYWVWCEDGSTVPGERSGAELMGQGLEIALPHRYTCDLVYVRDASLGKPDRIEPRGTFRAPPASVALPPAEKLAGIAFVSNMTWAKATAGAGNPVRRDTNLYGKPISIASRTHAKGVWTHAFPDATPADLAIDIEGKGFAFFAAVAGVDDAAKGGSVEFQILVDGRVEARSPLMRPGRAHPMRVETRGAKEIVLRVTNGGDGFDCDHAAWGSARFVAEGIEDPIAPAAAVDAPSHERPYFLPAGERERIRSLIRTKPWARKEYDGIRAAADKGDGYRAAFLYALYGDPAHLAAARSFLLGAFGPSAYAVKTYRTHLEDPEYFKTGQKGIPDVYYNLDLTGILAYDWTFAGLGDADRRTIEEGMLTLARFRMRAMDRWTQTPNLVLKPTFIVAMIGLATQDPDCLRWGFHRTKPWGKRLGGYFEVIDYMLRDGGVWHEAPIYPIAHESLWCMAMMSRLRGLYDGFDWFSHRAPAGGSPRGLTDYYIDTAYPIERSEGGGVRIRVATYGDGATGPGGDLYLIGAAPGRDLSAEKALIAAYNASGDPRYGSFAARIEGYAPDLWDRRPPSADPALPPAPSHVWPEFGLAMLRSDETPAYWTSGDAIAVFLVMSQGYGHDHRDKFGIMLHGAGRLLYPDYNAIQYENMAIGWTRNGPSHSTVLVDEEDPRDVRPTGIRHSFSPDVKFLAVSASGVFDGVDQTRALILTREYLLDLFHLESPVPHAYDYIIHAFGDASPAEPDRFWPSNSMVGRYRLVEDQKSTLSCGPWSITFTALAQPDARVRITMDDELGTMVTCGVWGSALAKRVEERSGGKTKLDRISTLIVRRLGHETIFASTHEPYAADARPKIRGVTTLARSRDAILVRIDGEGFTDYAAAAFGPQKEASEHVLGSGDRQVRFRDYGYARVLPNGEVTARSGWTSFSIVEGSGARPPSQGVPSLPLEISPATIRLSERDRRAARIRIRNPLQEAVRGHIAFDLPAGIRVEPAEPGFGPIESGGTAEVEVAMIAEGAAAGRKTIPYRIVFRREGSDATERTLAWPLEVVIGPTLRNVYRHPETPVFRLSAPRYEAHFRMYDGLCVRLEDDDGVARLDGSPLFTISDGKTMLLCEKTVEAFTWPVESPASLTAGAGDKVQCRWQAFFGGDRMRFRMDAGWTQFERAHVVVPGNWISPAAPPRWKRIVADPNEPGRVVAVELEFPGGAWNLAFRFEPPQEVRFEGAGMAFTIDALSGDSFQIGFCRPGEIDAWRTKAAAANR